MDFGFSEEQELLRGEARKLLDETCPLSEVRALCETPEGHSPEFWKRLGELGWLGLIVPEAHGGAGLGWLDLIVIERLPRGGAHKIDLNAMRAYRLARVRQELKARDYGGLLLYDPLNIRYATDTRNMSVWTMHNAVRYAFIATEGPVVMFARAWIPRALFPCIPLLWINSAPPL